MGTEFQGEISLISTSRNRDNPEAHVTSELNRQVPEPADTLNAHETRQRAPPDLRRALNVVKPAHNKGAASVDSSSGGTAASARAEAIIDSA